jgi:S1-C subfamily serine protease
MKKMKRIGLKVFFFITTFFLIGFSQTPQEIFQSFRPQICLVQFYKSVSSQAQIGSYFKVKQYRIGVIVSADGLVMVNSDVYPLSLDIISGEGGSFSFGEPSDFKVKLHDDTEYDAEFIGKDDLSRVAFVKITGELPAPLPFMVFRPGDGIEVGQPVYLLELLGEKYNFEPLFTPYTINAVIKNPRRKFLINTNATALSAGGIVITSGGEAIGVTLRFNTNFSFHSPSEFDEFQRDYLEIAPTEWFSELIQNPPVLEKEVYQGKAWLGIGMQSLTPELKEYWKVPSEGGVVINRVYPKSPAEKANLKVRDVILTFDYQPLDIKRDEDLNQFKEMITRKSPGNRVEISVFRDGKSLKETIELAPAPRAIDLAEKYQLSELGIEVRELTRDILYDYNLPLDTEGVYVFQVDRASPAGLGGVEMGSIITRVNGQTVKNLESFKETISNIMETDPTKLMFQVQYRKETQYVFVDMK